MMSRTRSLVPAIAAIIAVAALVAGAQELLNPSFEDNDPSPENQWSDRAANWGRWGNWINRETGWTPTHSGTCLIGYHHWEIQEDATSGVYQDIAGIPAGKKCLFSVYATKDEATNAESVELRLETLNGGEALASRVYSMDEIQSGSWGPLSVTGMNVTEGVRVLINVKPKQGGERTGAIKFDDASFAFQ